MTNFDEQGPADSLEILKQRAQTRRYEAQYSLGRMYESGKGVKPYSVEVIKWYRLATLKGHGGAKQSLQKIKNGG